MLFFIVGEVYLRAGWNLARGP